MIVQREVADKLIASLTNLVSKLTVEDGDSVPISTVGPVFSERHAQGLIELLQDAKNKGVEVLCGDLKNDGALVKPHMLVGVKPGMKAWERESFGPGTHGPLYSLRCVADSFVYFSCWDSQGRYGRRSHCDGQQV